MIRNCLLAIGLMGLAMADGKMELKDLPPAVKKTVEEQVDLDSFPAPAKAAILKQIADGKLTKAELVKNGSQLTYEAAYTTKGGKKKEK